MTKNKGKSKKRGGWKIQTPAGSQRDKWRDEGLHLLSGGKEEGWRDQLSFLSVKKKRRGALHHSGKQVLSTLQSNTQWKTMKLIIQSGSRAAT